MFHGAKLDINFGWTAHFIRCLPLWYTRLTQSQVWMAIASQCLPTRLSRFTQSLSSKCFAFACVFCFSSVYESELSTHPQNKKPLTCVRGFVSRSRADSNRCRSFCRALPSHSATGPFRDAKITQRS